MLLLLMSGITSLHTIHPNKNSDCLFSISFYFDISFIAKFALGIFRFAIFFMVRNNTWFFKYLSLYIVHTLHTFIIPY